MCGLSGGGAEAADDDGCVLSVIGAEPPMSPNRWEPADGRVSGVQMSRGKRVSGIGSRAVLMRESTEGDCGSCTGSCWTT